MARNSKKSANSQKPGDYEGEIIAGPPIPPDGGWGWVVMISSFIVSVLVDGVCLNIGVFFPYFLDYFQESKGKTSTAASVLNGTYLMIGPITSALCNRFGCRKVTIAGAVVSGIAFFLATFSPNVETLIFLYGAAGGFGFGLMYLPAIVMVGYYFEAKRALATGVAVCGSGIGLFVFAPLTEKLLSEYGWKGALWILSAIVLHGIVCGTAYRPLKPTLIKETVENGVNEPHKTDNTSAGLGVPAIVITPAKSDELFVEDVRFPAKASSRVFEGRIVSEECLARTPIPKIKAQKDISRGDWVGRLAKSQDISTLRGIHHHSASSHETEAERLFQPLKRKDIFYSGSIRNLAEFQSAGSVKDYENKVAGKPIHLHSVSDIGKSENWKNSFVNVLKDMIDVSLLSSPTFVVYLTACFLVMFGFFVPFAYIPSLALEMGIDGIDAAILVSILGITNTVGRIISGALSDRTWVDCVLINNAMLIFGGVISLFVPFYKNYTLLAVYSGLYGFSISPYVSLRSVIIVELLGLDKLTNAFGLVIFSQGVSSYIGAPVAGALADATGNYNAAFYMAGVALLSSGLMGLPLRRISQYERKRKQRGQNTDTVEEASELMPTAT